MALAAEGDLFVGGQPAGVEDGPRLAAGGLGLHMGDPRAVASLAADAEDRPVRVESLLGVPGERGGVAADAVPGRLGVV